jgi:uncharacterized protein (TIGR02246 family)
VRRRKRVAIPILILLLAAAVTAVEGAGAQAAPEPLPKQDADAIRAVIEAYRTAWLRGDAKGVLDTFTSDAALLPAHGAAPVVGTAAITNYWWPPNSPAATITRLDITVEGLQGEGRFASVYGHDDVEWTQVENGATKKYGHPGTYLNVLRKLHNGTWRISRHMWDDGLPPALISDGRPSAAFGSQSPTSNPS